MNILQAVPKLAKFVLAHGESFEDALAWQTVIDCLEEKQKENLRLKQENEELWELIKTRGLK